MKELVLVPLVEVLKLDTGHMINNEKGFPPIMIRGGIIIPGVGVTELAQRFPDGVPVEYYNHLAKLAKSQTKRLVRNSEKKTEIITGRSYDENMSINYIKSMNDTDDIINKNNNYIKSSLDLIS